jgi:nitrite reductase/ring-hydroxylating ferredoxin subunit
MIAAKDLAVYNLDVGCVLCDRLRTLRPSSVQGLAPGEAGLRALNGEKVAAYRDEDGRLHAVSGRCAHLGCLVAWNAAERTWDCPCHGSRFSYDGTGAPRPGRTRPATQAPRRVIAVLRGGLERRPGGAMYRPDWRVSSTKPSAPSSASSSDRVVDLRKQVLRSPPGSR